MKWQDVFNVHRKIGAVYFDKNKLKSVLFSSDKRRKRDNYRVGEIIYLCFDIDSKSMEITQILSLLKIGDSFTVFEKISPDCWEDAGLHECIGINDGNDNSGRKSLVLSIKPVKT